MSEVRRPGPPSEGGRNAIDTSRQSHDVLSTAQAHLYRVLAEAGIGREAAWAAVVLPSVVAAQDAIERHMASMRAPGGLYEELELDAPWLSPRLEELDRKLTHVSASAQNLVSLAQRAGTSSGVGDLRSAADALLAELREIMREENELVYERWLEPSALD